MKLITLLFIAAIFLSFQTSKISTNKISDDPDPQGKLNLFCPDPPLFTETVKTVSAKNETNPDNNNIDQSWYQKAMEELEKSEYNISYNENLGTYQSPNRANNLRFIYHKDGFTAKTRSFDSPQRHEDTKENDLNKKEVKKSDEWSIDFKIKGYSKHIDSRQKYAGMTEKNFDLLKDSELSVSENKATIDDDNIRIDYTNDKAGMRQDFIIKKKPEGEGKLRMNITADTKLKMIVGADALMFKDKNGIDKMKYSALKCWDANGKELRGIL
ncbi:MAG: hypothetical protein IPM38_15550 [Ignavibacteria bacterium]|nr:hypothetical protein [Ignavibacteria bacterium]